MIKNKINNLLNLLYFLFSLFFKGKIKFIIKVLFLGVISRTFLMVGFIFAIKVVVNPEINIYIGNYVSFDTKYIMIGMLALIFFTWSLSTRNFRNLLPVFDKEISTGQFHQLANSQKYFFENVSSYKFPYKFNSLILSKYPSILGHTAKTFILMTVNIAVMLIALFAMLYMNAIFTMYLLILLIFLLVFAYRKNKEVMYAKHGGRVKKIKFEKAIKKILNVFEKFDDVSPALPIDKFPYQQYKEIKRENIARVKGVEGSAFLVSLFVSVAIVSLLFNFLMTDNVVLSEMIIYLIMLRFFSSYSASLFRNLSSISNNYIELSNYYVYIQEYRKTKKHENDDLLMNDCLFNIRVKKGHQGLCAIEISKLLQDDMVVKPLYHMNENHELDRSFNNEIIGSEVVTALEKFGVNHKVMKSPDNTSKTVRLNSVEDGSLFNAYLTAGLSKKNMLVVSKPAWKKITENFKNFLKNNPKHIRLALVSIEHK